MAQTMRIRKGDLVQIVAGIAHHRVRLHGIFDVFEANSAHGVRHSSRQIGLRLSIHLQILFDQKLANDNVTA